MHNILLECDSNNVFPFKSHCLKCPVNQLTNEYLFRTTDNTWLLALVSLMVMCTFSSTSREFDSAVTEATHSEEIIFL
jgi:hypothetical protein